MDRGWLARPWVIPACVVLGSVAAAALTARVAASCLGSAEPSPLAVPQAPPVISPLGAPPLQDRGVEAAATSDGGQRFAEAGTDGGAAVDGPQGGAGARRRNSSARRQSTSGGDGDAIERLGSGSFLVQRGWVEEMLAQGSTGGTQALPVIEGERIQGYRLVGLSGGPLGRLGLREGDVLTAVNGRQLDSPDAALEAFQGARNASRVHLSLRRGGSPVSLSYRIEE